MTARRKWSKAKVIEAIRDRHRRGLPMKSVRKDDCGLELAGRQWFGTWHSAVLAAGISARPKWSKAVVIEAILDWHRKGVLPEKIWRKDPPLRASAHLQFGSWRKAIVAAGFQPTSQRWSKQRVLDELRTRYGNGIPGDFRWKDHSRLTNAARKYYGSWHDALVAAGLRRGKRKIRQPWNRQRVIKAIRARHEQGLPLSSVWREDKSLCSVAKKLFGNWRSAMKAAGFSAPPQRQWTAESVIEAIRDRRRRGLPLVGIYDIDRGLYSAARRHCGGWCAALRAAGVAPKPYIRWSRQSVIDALLKRQALGLSLSGVWGDDRLLYAAACREFGSWDDALKVSGLPRRRIGRWSEHRVIVELRAWHGQADDDRHPMRSALVAAAARFFGTLGKAMDAAGVQPKRQMYWTKGRVIETIQDHYTRGRPIQFIGFGDKALAAAACRRFGGWREALAAAGLAEKYREPARRRRWTKQAVIEAILDRRRQGLPLINIARKDAGLYQAAEKYCGGWRKALAAAGINRDEKVA